MEKSADAFRTISEVAEDLALPQHVLRFWETRFPQIRPLKRAGGRRYYRPADVGLLRTIRELLYDDGYTIKGVQRLLKEQGARGLGTGAPISDSARAMMRNTSGRDDEPVDDETVAVPADASGHARPADVDAARVDAAQVDAAQVDAISGGSGRRLVESALETVNECRRMLDTVLRPARRS